MSGQVANPAMATDGPVRFAFIFPMFAGHINPSLPMARRLVQEGYEVHYLCYEPLRKAIEDTGAVFHSEVESQPELFEGRGSDLFTIVEALRGDHVEMHDDSLILAWLKLSNVILQDQLPGTIRFLEQVKPSAVVYCPLCSRHAGYAAEVLSIPSVALLTIAGPGSCGPSNVAMLASNGLDHTKANADIKANEANLAAVRHLNMKYGIGVDVSVLGEPLGKLEVLAHSFVTIVTTCDDLQDPMTAELQRSYEQAGTTFISVGPLLDQSGAVRAELQQAAPAANNVSANVLAMVRSAKSTGRQVVLVSMGTVLTADSGDLGWNGRVKGSDGETRGLTGKQLCHSAWSGAFDEFGAGHVDEGPLLVVSVGIQEDALADIVVPPNALCAASLPQVDILNAGIDVFLTHGGQNSFMEGLANGVPLVVCPGFGDQVVNARRAEDIGIGLQVDRPDPDAGKEPEAAAAYAYRTEVSHALRRVLKEQSFKNAAVGQAEKLRQAGGISRAVQVVLSAASSSMSPSKDKLRLLGFPKLQVAAAAGA